MTTSPTPKLMLSPIFLCISSSFFLIRSAFLYAHGLALHSQSHTIEKKSIKLRLSNTQEKKRCEVFITNNYIWKYFGEERLKTKLVGIAKIFKKIASEWILNAIPVGFVEFQRTSIAELVIVCYQHQLQRQQQNNKNKTHKQHEQQSHSFRLYVKRESICSILSIMQTSNGMCMCFSVTHKLNANSRKFVSSVFGYFCFFLYKL